MIGLLQASDRPNDAVADYAGLWSTRPWLALLMAMFLLSLGGFPPLGGFVAKWYVFTAAMQAGHTWLALVGVLTSVISVFFYLRVVVMIYMTPPNGPAHVSPGAPCCRGGARRVGGHRPLSGYPAGARPGLGRRVDQHFLTRETADFRFQIAD